MWLVQVSGGMIRHYKQDMNQETRKSGNPIGIWFNQAFAMGFILCDALVELPNRSRG